MSKNPVFPKIKGIEFTADEIVSMLDYEITMYQNDVGGIDMSDYDKGFGAGIEWMRSLFSAFCEEK